MVLRLIVLVLTVANLAYFGWSEGWLDGVMGPRSTGEREPARADAQVRPEVMVLSEGKGTITAGLAPSSAASPASMATVAASAASTPATGRVSTSASATSMANGSMTGAAATSPIQAAPAPATPSSPASAAPVQPSATHGAASSARSAVASSPSAATGSLSAATSSGASSPTVSAAPGIAAHPASAGAVTSPASSAATGNACVQSGPYAAKDATAVESAFKTVLPAGGWTRVSVDKPGVWMIYMGRFADNEARRKKEGELSRRNATFEEVEAPAEFAKGLSLGRFASRADAEKGLADLNKLGVHTARIVTFTAPVQASLLRADKLDAATADKLKALRTPLPVVACEP